MAYIHLKQGVLYKKFVNTLAVFICEASLEFFQTLDGTARMPFHRYFILPDDSIKNATGITIKPTDSFMYMKISNTDYAMIQRLIVAYSNPMYEKIVIFKNNKDINFFNISSLFQESNYFETEEYIGFTRRSFVLDGTKKLQKEEIKSDPINDYDFMDNIGIALDGEPVSKNIFLKALEEILPLCKFDYHQSTSKLEKDIISLISSKNHQSSNTIYKIYYNQIPVETRNSIIFSHEELDVYSYVIRRTDGLKCFIL
jgi:hypothetical protein